ncbi:MAG: hypothetical protein RSC75_12450 [Bacteroidales bacterium]
MSNQRPLYAIYKTNRTNLNSTETAKVTEYHVRLSARSTISSEEMAHDIAMEKHFNIETTLSLLNVLSQYIERKNSEGHIVKIDGLGSFMPALHVIEPITDPDAVKNSRIKIKDLSFVTDRNLTRRLRCVDLLRDWEKGNCTMTAEDRHQRILEYFDDQIERSSYKNEFMLTCKTVMDLNRCGRSTASADLGILTERGEIRRLSVGNRTLYMRNIRE